MISYVGHRLRGKMWRRLYCCSSGVRGIRSSFRSTFEKIKTSIKRKRLTYNARNRAIIGGLIALLFLPIIFAKPSVVFTGVTVQPDGTYYKGIHTGSDNTLSIQVQNNENITYQYTISYNGNISVTIKYGANVIGSGNVFTTQAITINPSTTQLVYFIFHPNTAGDYHSAIDFSFKRVEGNTTYDAGVSHFAINLHATSSGTAGGGATQNEPKQCLNILRNKIYKVVYMGTDTDISVAIANECSNTNLELVDADLEGIPAEIAYIKDGELGKLSPGDVTYLKIHVSTKKIKRPTKLSFSLIVYGKKGTTVEHDEVVFDVTVLKEDQIPGETNTYTEEGPKPLQVDYVVQSGYLIVKGVYITDKNGTRIYLSNIPVDILVDNKRITYNSPIEVVPGKTYCISAAATGYVSFFKCEAIPKKELCVSFDPDGKKVGGTYYWLVGTTVKATPYDCETGEPIKDYTMFLGDQKLSKPEFIVEEKKKSLKITSSIYKDKQIVVAGYVPVTVTLPETIYASDNVTIRFDGTFAKQVEFDIYKKEGDKYSDLVYSGRGPVQVISLEPGEYKIELSTPVGEKEYYFTVRGRSPLELIKRIILYVLVGFAIFTIILAILIKKKGGVMEGINLVDQAMK